MIAAACGGEDPVAPDPGPPDVTGTWLAFTDGGVNSIGLTLVGRRDSVVLGCGEVWTPDGTAVTPDLAGVWSGSTLYFSRLAWPGREAQDFAFTLDTFEAVDPGEPRADCR